MTEKHILNYSLNYNNKRHMLSSRRVNEHLVGSLHLWPKLIKRVRKGHDGRKRAYELQTFQAGYCSFLRLAEVTPPEETEMLGFFTPPTQNSQMGV